jgi:hypothetical protein
MGPDRDRSDHHGIAVETLLVVVLAMSARRQRPSAK